MYWSRESNEDLLLSRQEKPAHFLKLRKVLEREREKGRERGRRREEGEERREGETGRERERCKER